MVAPLAGADDMKPPYTVLLAVNSNSAREALLSTTPAATTPGTQVLRVAPV